MSKHLIVPDQHSHPDHHNDRADWIGKLIRDEKPDVVINMGDAADMASLSQYDKGKAQFYGRSYERDINSHLDFQDRMWAPTKKAKKKQPRKVVLEGNHEHRIKKALDISPELGGERYGLSFKDLDWDNVYHDVVPYKGQTPGIICIDGVHYSHYFISGVMGRPIGGEHHAYSLIAKNHVSCVAAHSHTADYAIRTDTTGKHIQGLVCGVYQDYDSDWAGHVNDLWYRCAVILREVQDGNFDPQFISLKSLKKEYS